MSLLRARPIQAARPGAGRRSASGPGTLTHAAAARARRGVRRDGATLGVSTPERARRRLPGRFRLPGRRREQADGAGVLADFERDARAVGFADVDGLPVLDVDRRHPPAVHINPVERVVVHRPPAALLEAQQHVRPGDQRVRHPQVGAQVAADDHVTARGEAAFGAVGSGSQHGLRGASHHTQIRVRGRPAGLSVSAGYASARSRCNRSTAAPAWPCRTRRCVWSAARSGRWWGSA